ncbi:MAG: ribonuclease J [Anaerolineae bacterium]
MFNETLSEGKLRLTPLGGLGEIGRNMLVLEYGESIVIIDAGFMFPEVDMLGIDMVIPDLSYVSERADRVEAVIITHGHLDHIGALPYLMEKVDAPIYATRLTRGLIELKMHESHIQKADIRLIEAGGTLSVAPFDFEFFHVNHSIPDGVGMAIDTPVGLLVHSGDFKFDPTPVYDRPTDLGKLAELGERGVLLFLSDSTNSETPGHTPSEQALGETISRLFNRAKGRVLLTTFASNISRIQQAMDISQEYGRRIAVVGRSMRENLGVARELGYLKVPDEALINLNQIDDIPDHRLTLLCTGSQGEPTSALVRMGQRRYHSVSIVPGDTIIISASAIPGNEELINRTLDNLFRLGADVYYDEILDVHVSGHASQEEQRLVLSLVRPEYFVPIHGEYRHLVLHGKLAERCGVAPENVLIAETGDVLEITPSRVELIKDIHDRNVFVDGRSVGDVGRDVIEERQALARNGFLVATVMVDKYTGGILGEPTIITQGFVKKAESKETLEGIKEEIEEAVEGGGTRAEMERSVRSRLQSYMSTALGRRPIVITEVKKV